MISQRTWWSAGASVALALVLVLLGQPVQAALVSYWSFDASGTAAYGDAATAGSSVDNGTLTGAGAVAPGMFGNALSLGGAGWVNAGRGADFQTNNYTISSWVNVTGGSSWRNIFSCWTPNSYWEHLCVDSSNKFGDFMYNGTTQLEAQSTTTPALNTWYHVVAARSGDTMSVYVNAGTPATTTVASAYPVPLTDVFIGSRDAGNNLWVGLIDDLAFFNNTLSAEKVKSLYNAPMQVAELSAYGAGKMASLFAGFDAGTAARAGSQFWTPVSGLTGHNGGDAWTDGGAYFVQLDASGNGMQGTNIATRTWSGTAGGNWNSADNWNGTAPVAGDALVFAGSDTTNSNDFAANTPFSGITFDAGASAFTLSGNAIDLAGDVMNGSGVTQQINLPVRLIPGGGTFNAAGGNITVNQPISEAAGSPQGLTKTGGGTLTLNAASSYTGVTTVNAGTLAYGAADAIVDGALNVTGGTVDFAAFSPNVQGVTMSGGSILGSGTLTGTSYAVQSGSIGVGLAGAGGLSKSSTGLVTLSGVNSYGGTTNVAAGTLEIASGGTLDNAAQILVGGTGMATLTISGGNVTNTRGASGNTMLVGANGGQTGVVNITGGSLTLANDNSNYAVTLADYGTGIWNQSGGATNMVGAMWGANQGGSVAKWNVSGGTLTTGGFLLTQRGAGTLTISDTGSVTTPFLAMVGWTEPRAAGTVNLNGGTLTAGYVSRNSPGQGAQGTATFNFNGGTLQAGGDSTTFMTGLNAANVRAGGALIDTQSYNITIGQVLRHDPALGAVLDGGLTKTGSGILTLTATNTYTGTTTVNNGTLQLGNGSNVNGSVAGNITLANASMVTLANPYAQSYGGNISGSGSLTKSGPGLLVLSGANTYDGGTTINSGTLQAAKTAALAEFGTAGKVFVANGATLALNVGGAGEFTAADVTSVLSNATFDFTSYLALDTTNSGGNFGYDTPISTFSLGLAKQGAGTLTLTRASTYWGGTAVNHGTLLADFSAAGAPADDILPSGTVVTLRGTGELKIQGKPGATNSQALGDLTFATGSTAVTLAANGGTLNVSAGDNWTRNAGSSVDFTLGGATLASNPTTNAGSLVIGSGSAPFATVNRGDWATVSGGNVVAYSAYADDDYSAGANTNITAVNPAPATVASGTLAFRAAQANTLTLPEGTSTLGSGGILVGSQVGGNATAISGGALTSATNELIVHQHGSGVLTVNSPIVNNGANATSLTKAGAGTLAVGGNNTYTGATVISGGMLRLSPPATALPSSISGLVVQLDANDVTGTGVNPANGTQLSTWVNKAAGGAGDFTGAASPYLNWTGNPMNGRSLVHFWGGVLRNNTNFGNNVTVMYVGRMDGGANYRLLSAENNWLLGYWGGNMNTDYWTNGGQLAGALDYNSHIFVGTADGTTAWAYNADGTETQYDTRALGAGPNGLVLGGWGNNGGTASETSYGDIGEVLVFNRALTATERQQMAQYLQAKWYGTLPSKTAVNITVSGAGLDLNGVNQTIGSLAGVEGSQVVLNGAYLTTGQDSTSTTFSGAISDGTVGGGGLSKIGAGTLTLAGSTANTYAGPTVISQGSLVLSKNANVTAVPGDILMVNSLSPSLWMTADNQLGGNGVLSFANEVNGSIGNARFMLQGTTQSVAGIVETDAYRNAVIQNSEPGIAGPNVNTLGTLVITGSGTYSFNGYLRDQTGLLAVVMNGSGTQVFSGDRITYTGGTTVNSGTLSFAAANTGRGALTVNDGGTFLSAGANAIDSMSGPFTINAGGLMTKNTAPDNINGQLILNGGTLGATVAGSANYGNWVLNYNVAPGVIVGGTSTSTIAADVRVGNNQDRVFQVGVTGDPSGIDLDITGKIGHLNNVSWGYMTKTGAGTMRFNNPALNSDIGRITVNDGKVIFKDYMAAMGNGGLINNAWVEADMGEGIVVSFAPAVSGTGTFAKTGAGMLTLSGATPYTGTTIIEGGTLQFGNGGAVALSTASVTLSNAGVLAINHSNATTFASPITGQGSLIKAGGGILTLSGANAYDGGTTINGGSLVFGNAGSLPATGDITINVGTALAASGPFATVTEWLDSSRVFSGSEGALGLTGDSSETIDLTTAGGGNYYYIALGSVGDNTYSGTLTPNGGSYHLGGGNGMLTVTSPLVAAGNGLTVTGNITLAGDEANTYDGTTIVSRGTSFLNKSGGVAAIPADTTLQIGTGLADQPTVRMSASDQFGDGVVMTTGSGWGLWARVDLLGTNQTLAGLEAGTSAIQSSGLVIQNGGIGAGSAANATLTIDNMFDYSFCGHMRDYDNINSGGKLNLIKEGAGTQTFVGQQITYTGPTTINGGTLKLLETWQFNSPVTVNTEGTLEVATSGNPMTAYWPITNHGTVNINPQGRLDRTTGQLVGTGTYNITAPNGFRLLNGGGFGATGQINILAGRVYNDNLNANWSGNTAGVDVGSSGILDLRGQSIPIGALTGTGTVRNSYGTGTNVLTIGAGDGSGEFSGLIEGSGNGAGEEQGIIALLKTGAGTQILSGLSTYSGGTTVNGGILEIAAVDALPAGRGLTIGAGGTVVLSSGLSAAANTTAASAVPEPSTFLLLGIAALCGLAVWHRKRG